jgi:LytR cell envelope-related transcriptional attenuator
MAHPRTDLQVLEQPRRHHLRLALIGAALLVSAGAGAVLFQAPRPAPAVSHAYAVPSPDHRVQVEVLNGSRRPGAARGATRLLRQRGLDVVFFGNANRLVDSTQILVRRGDPANGRAVRAALGVGRVVVDPDTLRRVDVSVVLGQDFRPKLELHP